MDAEQAMEAWLLLLSPVIWGLFGGLGAWLLWRNGYGRTYNRMLGFFGVLGGLVTLCAWLLLPRKAIWQPIQDEPPVIDITPDRTTARAKSRREADMERFQESMSH